MRPLDDVGAIWPTSRDLTPADPGIATAVSHFLNTLDRGGLVFPALEPFVGPEQRGVSSIDRLPNIIRHLPHVYIVSFPDRRAARCGLSVVGAMVTYKVPDDPPNVGEVTTSEMGPNPKSSMRAYVFRSVLQQRTFIGTTVTTAMNGFYRSRCLRNVSKAESSMRAYDFRFAL
jgi:hypothetical protein